MKKIEKAESGKDVELIEDFGEMGKLSITQVLKKGSLFNVNEIERFSLGTNLPLTAFAYTHCSACSASGGGCC